MPAPAVTQTMPQRSPFLALPREIRDQIYQLTFADNIVYLSRFARSESEKPDTDNSGLLTTCQQIRSEAAEPYYKTTFFYGRIMTIKSWLRMLQPEHCAFIREINVVEIRAGELERSVVKLFAKLKGMEMKEDADKIPFLDARGELVWAVDRTEGYNQVTENCVVQ